MKTKAPSTDQLLEEQVRRWQMMRIEAKKEEFNQV